ncbi:MAG: hypothetical protein JHC96_04610 [Brevundimonas sp.]|uniref:hypothetical protein n=1 Tax=Brevundimonas sp. TaxID=1871086 RepID=UPI001A242D36|nr:hypothetical protein [Brevundimonas sp.]MBJ7318063.1 hypothetical protein [Brevundimonas sp.]
MSEETFNESLAEALDLIDRWLGELNVPLRQRPLQAALEFVRHFIIEIKVGDQEPQAPGDIAEVILAEWFKPIMQDVNAWYVERYGKRMDPDSGSPVIGTVRIFGTPFEIRVPTSTHSPGVPGETIWVEFPDRVLEREEALDWLVDGPNTAKLARADYFKAKRHAHDVATALRFITIAINGISNKDVRAHQLAKGVVPHLERAAAQLIQTDQGSLKRAHWDMQMAVELAFKALTQQRSDTFTETHDLFVLFDRLPNPELDLPRRLLSMLPNWEVMAQLRYGEGPDVSLDDAFVRYRTCLKIVAGIADGFKRWRLGQARFEIKKAPWLGDGLPSANLPPEE